MLNVVMLRVIMLSVVMLSVVMLIVIMLSVIMLNVVMRRVVAPENDKKIIQGLNHQFFNVHLAWRHDIQHNGTQHNDTQPKGHICNFQHKQDSA